MLADYEPPAIDEGVDEGLRDFISEKKDAVPDSNV